MNRSPSQPAVRPLAGADRPWARALLAERWGSHVIVTRGRLHAADALDGFVAETTAAPAGLATWRIDGDACELVSLDAVAKGRGVGTALLRAVEARARAAGCRRLWLVTTNDNVPARRFYERRGFVVAAVHENAVAASRALKPEIPHTGVGGVPIRDEIEMERLLTRTIETEVAVSVTEENKALVRRYVEEVINTGRTGDIGDFVASDYVEVHEGVRHAAGLKGAAEHIAGVRQTYPDLELTVERQIAEGEWVVTCITARGTHRGTWLGMAPTNKAVAFTGVNVDRVVDGRIVEHGGAANLLLPLLGIGAVRVVGPGEGA